jgi:hypothetical protein
MVTVTAVLLLAGCSKDEAVRKDLSAIDRLTDQLVESVESARDPGAGVKAGRELLTAHRAEIVERLNRIGAVRGFQVNAETKKLIAKSVVGNLAKVNRLKVSMFRATVGNDELSAALDSLIDDYNSLLKAGK